MTIGKRGEGCGAERGRGSLLSAWWFHAALLAVGTAFLLADAFHGNVWFDESYSVGIANHSFTEIWRIGSGDVHPVLFYWALHALNLVFGQNVLVYRLFAVAGAVALAVLGATHVRRDFGWRVGVLFSFFALFVPYIAIMAVEIRMYSWATFAVMLCGVYAFRIFACVRKSRPASDASAAAGIAARAASLPQWAGVPRRWWLVFFISSLACAYLHYFGVLSAFSINVLLFAYLLYRCKDRPRALGIFLVGAVVQVALFFPWLLVLKSQAGVVSQSYWAKIIFPTTYIELATYPIMTSQVSFASRGAYGSLPQIILQVLWYALLALLAAGACAALLSIMRARRQKKEEALDHPSEVEVGALRRGPLRRFGCWLASDAVLPGLCALAVYVMVFAIAWTASMLMNSLILYYRYLFVAIGPLLFFCSFVLAQVRMRWFVGGSCALLLCVSAINQVLLVADDYDAANRVPLERFEEIAASGELIVSTDIGFEGVTAVTYPDIPQMYMDWQKGNWGTAYQAYAPALSSKKSWELIFDDFHGSFIVLGQSQKNELPRDIVDLSAKPGFTCLETETYYRPYERTYFTIARMTKE